VTLGKTETIVQRRQNAIAAFAAWGIVPEQIFASLEVGGLDDIGLEEISVLTAMFRAIKAGDQTVEAYFPPKVDAVAARQAAKGTARKPVDDTPLPGPSAPIEKQAEPTPPAANVAAGPAEQETPNPEPAQKANTKPRADVQYVEDKAATKAAKAEPERTAEAPAQGSMLDEAPKEIDWSMNTFGRAFMADVKDMGFEGAVDLHDQQIAQIKDEKPGLYAYIVAESEKLANA
jgi:hypothetical protein